MNGWVLYKGNANLRKSEENNAKDFIKYGEKLGANMRFVNPEEVDFICDNEAGEISFFICGELITTPNFAISYQGVQSSNHFLILLDALKSAGTFLLNTKQAILDCKSKIDQILILARNKVPYPTSTFMRSPADFVAKCKFIQYPVLLKPVESTQGMGIMMIENESQLIEVANYVREHNKEAIFMAQHFVKESSGKAIRLVVLNGEIAACYYKIAPDSYKANVASGAKVVRFQPTQNLSDIGIAAAKAFGLNFAGIDVLERGEEYLVCDVNSAPSLAAAHEFNLALAELVLMFIMEKLQVAGKQNA
ncbi:MAG: RimK family alpha-L-glutamate ligase [Bacteroidia bacterium]